MNKDHSPHQPNIAPDSLGQHEIHFTELAKSFGGVAVLEFFNAAELSGGAVSDVSEDEMRAIALRDGLVHVQYSRGMSFNMPYARARELAVGVAREEIAQATEQST